MNSESSAGQGPTRRPVLPPHRQAGPGMAIFALVVLGFGLLVGRYLRLTPPSASGQAAQVDLLFSAMLGIAASIFLLVEGVIVYSAIRYRRRPGDDRDGAPVHGSNRLEFAWTLVPTLIVVWLGLYSYQTLLAIRAAEPAALTVEVTGRQFQWEFRYPTRDVISTDLYLPQGRPVHLQITSADVLHSFWIPAFRIKQDAIPGRMTEIRFTPDTAGNYSVVCAGLCGAGHAFMGLQHRAIVLDQFEFNAWLGGQQPGGVADPVALFAKYGCAACHTLPAANATGNVGPSLEGLADRAGTRVPGLSAEEYVRQSILDPGAYLVEGFQPVMPKDFAQRIPPPELEALVRFLLGVPGGPPPPPPPTPTAQP